MAWCAENATPFGGNQWLHVISMWPPARRQKTELISARMWATNMGKVSINRWEQRWSKTLLRQSFMLRIVS